MVIPPKLQPGDEIRVVAPATSANSLTRDTIERAQRCLENYDFRVTFAEHIFETDELSSSQVGSRLADLAAAFHDPSVKGILTVLGGFNSIELVSQLDYALVERNPKVFCGYSDITSLANAITAKTGLVTYSGPHFSSFAMEGLQEYQSRHFFNCCGGCIPYDIKPSDSWSQDKWYLRQTTRNYHLNRWSCYSRGIAEGIAYGGNLGSLNLLHGSEYQPNYQEAILFVENAEEESYQNFARELSALLQVVGQPKALLIGRFPRETAMTEARLLYILGKYPQLRQIPVLYNLNFGHTQPIFTFPIGGRVRVDAYRSRLTMLEF